MMPEEPKRMFARVRELYNEPPETPREEMWAAISTEIRDPESPVIDLAEFRGAPAARLRRRRWVAVAALMVVGIGIGRLTVPGREGSPAATSAVRNATGLDVLARQHLGRSASLLRVVRTDARSGQLDPTTASWARGLLAETRLLLDAGRAGDRTVERLLEDLELVLVQIVGVAETGSLDEARARIELDLAMRSLEMGEVLPRIREAVPLGIAGT